MISNISELTSNAAKIVANMRPPFISDGLLRRAEAAT